MTFPLKDHLFSMEQFKNGSRFLRENFTSLMKITWPHMNTMHSIIWKGQDQTRPMYKKKSCIFWESTDSKLTICPTVVILLEELDSLKA